MGRYSSGKPALIIHFLIWSFCKAWIMPNILQDRRINRSLQRCQPITAVDELDRLVGTEQIVTVVGTIVKTRPLGSSLSFLDLELPTSDIVQALLKRQQFVNGTDFSQACKASVLGATLQLHGNVRASKSHGEPLVLIEKLKLLRLPHHNPQHVRILLSLILEEQLLPWNDELSKSHNMTLHRLIEMYADETRNCLRGTSEKYKPDPLQELAKRLVLPHPKLETTTAANQEDYQLPLAPTWLRRGLTKDVTNFESVNSMCLTGYVQNRRRYQDGICVLVIDKSQCILHPSSFDSSNVYATAFAPGSRVEINGLQQSYRNSTTVLWAKDATPLRASSRPATIRYLIDMVRQDERMDVTEVARALGTNEARLLSDDEDAVWLANELSTTQPQSRRATILQSNHVVLDKYASLRQRYPLQPALVPTGSIGSSGALNSRFQRKKLPQLQFMLERVQDLMDHKNETVRILDVGGGRGLLAQYLAESLPAAEIHVLELSEGAVRNGIRRSERRKVTNMFFHQGDASHITLGDMNIDIVVALHACGVLTDIALHHAVQHKASFCICPCCYASNTHLRIGPQRQRDAEWMNANAVDYRELQRIAELQGVFEMSNLAMHSIGAVRTASVQKMGNWSQMAVLQFPVAFSTRNLALFGRKEKCRCFDRESVTSS